MGSPDPREIDGMGGGAPVDLEGRRRLEVDSATTPTSTTCSCRCGPTRGGLRQPELRQPARRGRARSRSRKGWSRRPATSRRCGSGWRTPRRSRSLTCRRPAARFDYDGTARIDGVPGTHAPIPDRLSRRRRLDAAAHCCPTGHAADEVNGVRVTCIDNGMPVVCIKAEDVGLTGHESPSRHRRRTPR